MRIALGAVAGLLLASATATPALAQNVADTRSSTFSLGGGVSFPQGDALEDMNTGWIVTGGLAINPTSLPFGLRLEALYTRFGSDEISVVEPEGSFSAEVSTGIFGGSVNAIFGPSAMASGVRPYFIGGVGIYNVNFDFDIELSGGGQSGSISTSEDETAFGLNGGAGLEFNVGPLRSFVEARYHTIFTDFEGLEEDGGSMRTSFVPIVIGLRF